MIKFKISNSAINTSYKYSLSKLIFSCTNIVLLTLYNYFHTIHPLLVCGGYYGTALQVFQGVTQGHPLSPTIFNVVVGAVVRNWVEVMVEQLGGQDGRGQEGQHQSTIFYADDGMVASSEPVWMQKAFSTLLGLLDWVGLRKNVRKTVRMVCHLCQAVVTQSEAAYKQ